MPLRLNRSLRATQILFLEVINKATKDLSKNIYFAGVNQMTRPKLPLLTKAGSILTSGQFWLGVMVPVVVGLVGLTPWILEEDKTDIQIERVEGLVDRNLSTSPENWWLVKEINAEEYRACSDHAEREMSRIDALENSIGMAVVRIDLRNEGTRSATIKNVRLRHGYSRPESSGLAGPIPSMAINSPINFGPNYENTGKFTPYIYLAGNGIVSLEIPIRPSVGILLEYKSICLNVQVNYYDGTQDSSVSQKIELTPFSWW